MEPLSDRLKARIKVAELKRQRKDLLSRISIDPEICFGKPCIKGHRIRVSLMLDFLATGKNTKDLLAEYPGLEEAVLACIAYGAEMSRQRYIDLEAEI